MKSISGLPFVSNAWRLQVEHLAIAARTHLARRRGRARRAHHHRLHNRDRTPLRVGGSSRGEFALQATREWKEPRVI